MTSSASPERLRAQRKNPTVLKSELAKLREHDRCSLVIVLEGKDDLPAYEIWLTRLLGNFEWEPMVAQGKANLLAFRELLKRDVTGISACTYFITDHDYDGLRASTGEDDIFVLPAYSVENFLTSPSVLDSFLRTDLRVVGARSERETALQKYLELRDDFFNSVLSACKILFGARNESVGNVRVAEVPPMLQVVDNQLVVNKAQELSGLVSTERPVSKEGIKAAEDFFAGAELELWIRGKFVLQFFREFCLFCYSDRNAEDRVLFAKGAADRSFPAGALDTSSLAARSPIPSGLREKLEFWAAKCAEECKAA